MPEISHFAVASDADDLLEIVAIATPDDQQSGSEVWLARELPRPADAEEQWPRAWQSLGAPGGEHQLDGIAMAAGVGGGLETAVLTQNRTIWHARQDDADGNWSAWESLGNPVSGGTITPPALAQNQDGRLELFTVAFFPRPAVWHRSQPHVGQSQWGGWSSLGFPQGQSGGVLTSAAPAVALNRDGRMEVFLLISGKIWHSWQKSAGAQEWMPWRPLGGPDEGGPVGLPTAALDVDGRLQVLTASGSSVWMRGQHGPGQGPWESWLSPGPLGFGVPGVTGEIALAVAAQEGGRLVVFVLRNRPDGTQSLEKMEQEGGLDEQWIGGDPIEVKFLGKPGFVPTADDPVLALDGRGRLRLFLTVPGTAAIYALNQTSAAGGEWLESLNNIQAP